ncbi:AAA family ATPase [Candidatus Curtissbacteria bacterium]|nr:AAA family ATPase [Candidatus Curtissbacteria bacterium]
MPTAQYEDIQLLETKLQNAKLPTDLKQKALAQVERLVRMVANQGYSQEYDSTARYIDWIVSLPWDKRSLDPVNLENAKKVLDSNHYGLESIKERILEFLAVSALKNKQAQVETENSKAPAILLLGLVGTGKTTMAYSIAQALGRKFGRIPMGGMGDALQLRGRARAYPDAEPGQIVKTIRRAQTMNPVILLDEIDRVTDEARADIMGVLVELLDPEQNNNFLDHYLDYPVNLSEVLFIATANNTGGIATAVLDRLEVVEMPSYSDQQKVTIGKEYLLPRAIKTNGLTDQDIAFDQNVWEQIVRPLGFDAGMRTLDRTISGICRKVAKLKVEGQLKEKLTITVANIKQYTPSW